MATVDVVIVAYNSRARLRGCVEPLVGLADVNVVVVDNASPDRSLDAIADLPIQAISSARNGGFAYGCNLGWRSGSAPFVLLVNPDATIDERSLRTLVGSLEADERTGIVGPLIVEADGTLDYSQRRFPRLASTYSQALFLHRFFRRAGWSDEVNRRDEEYARPASPDWVSGACLLVRRTVLEQVGGLDEGYFMYGEDKDLCHGARSLGYDVRFAPEAVCVHIGGDSLPRATLLPVLASSRVRFARKHCSRSVAEIHRLGICLGELTHGILGRGGGSVRRGHLRACARVLLHPPGVDET